MRIDEPGAERPESCMPSAGCALRAMFAKVVRSSLPYSMSAKSGS